MALNAEQIKELKEQLKEQVNQLPESQRAAAIKQIDSMSPEALESMLKQQSMASPGSGTQKGIFRSLVDGDMKSYLIAENKDSIAVLDIKPISQGHIIIIPKKPLTDSKLIPNACFSLAKKIAKKISKKLSAKSSEIQTEYKFGELIINLIPVYDKSLSLNSPRMDAKEKDLESLEAKLKIVKKNRIKKIKAPVKIVSSALKLNRRIP